ncbi:MAG: hypothetical protein ACJ76S_12055 [Solirubrobacteraceae bacterium]
MIPARLRGATVAAGLAATLAACGGPAQPELDVIWLQRQLTPRVAQETRAAVDQMACPQVVPRPGRVIECSAGFNGEADIVVVTLLDGRVRPRYRYRLKNLLLGALEQSIQHRLREAHFPAASVDCPGPVPQRRGQVSQCRVEDPQGRGAEVRVTQVDDRGHVRLRPLRRRPR